MEPGDLRESPAGSGESDAGDWREVIPGGEDDEKGAENIGNALDATLKDTCNDSDKQKGVGEPLHSPYEEELDPRIQVGEPSSDSGSWSLVLLYLINKSADKHKSARMLLLPTPGVCENQLLKDAWHTNKNAFMIFW